MARPVVRTNWAIVSSPLPKLRIAWAKLQADLPLTLDRRDRAEIRKALVNYLEKRQFSSARPKVNEVVGHIQRVEQAARVLNGALTPLFNLKDDAAFQAGRVIENELRRKLGASLSASLNSGLRLARCCQHAMAAMKGAAAADNADEDEPFRPVRPSNDWEGAAADQLFGDIDRFFARRLKPGRQSVRHDIEDAGGEQSAIVHMFAKVLDQLPPEVRPKLQLSTIARKIGEARRVGTN